MANILSRLIKLVEWSKNDSVGQWSPSYICYQQLLKCAAVVGCSGEEKNQPLALYAIAQARQSFPSFMPCTQQLAAGVYVSRCQLLAFQLSQAQTRICYNIGIAFAFAIAMHICYTRLLCLLTYNMNVVQCECVLRRCPISGL